MSFEIENTKTIAEAEALAKKMGISNVSYQAGPLKTANLINKIVFDYYQGGSFLPEGILVDEIPAGYEAYYDQRNRQIVLHPNFGDKTFAKAKEVFDHETGHNTQDKMFKKSFDWFMMSHFTEDEIRYIDKNLGDDQYPRRRYNEEKKRGTSEAGAQKIYAKEVYALIVQEFRRIEYYNKTKSPNKKEETMDTELMRIYNKIITLGESEK